MNIKDFAAFSSTCTILAITLGINVKPMDLYIAGFKSEDSPNGFMALLSYNTEDNRMFFTGHDGKEAKAMKVNDWGDVMDCLVSAKKNG